MAAKGQQPNRRGIHVETALFVAVKRGDSEQLKCILVPPYQEELLNARHRDGNTALHVAVGRNCVHIIRQLVSFQPKLCLLTNREQETPICMAAKLGHLEAVKELIESNPHSVMERNSCGMNILHLVAQVSQVRIVDYLVAQVSQLRIVDYLNKTIKLDLLCVLVNQGLERPLHGPEKPPKIKPFQWGDTPLHIAARNKNFNMVISLLNIRGINKEAFNDAGQTALDIARENTEYHESYQIISLLTSHPPKKKPFLYSAPKVSDLKYKNATKMVDKTYDARRDKELVVAVLLATMSFTAIFTIPGGFKTDLKNGEREKMLGMPILIAIDSFKMFIIFDCLAFFLSLFAVLMWQMSSPLTTGDKVFFLVINNLLVCASYACTACGFMAAVYTMLEYKHGKLAWCMFWSSIIVGCSALLSFIYLSARFSVKLARFNYLRGVHPFLRDCVLEWVWLRLERLGVLDIVRSFKLMWLNWLYGYNLGKDESRAKRSGSVENMSCEDRNESSEQSIAVGMPNATRMNRGVNLPAV